MLPGPTGRHQQAHQASCRGPAAQSEAGFADLDADTRSSYLFNSTIAGVDQADAILLVRVCTWLRGRGQQGGPGTQQCQCTPAVHAPAEGVLFARAA